MSNYTGVQTTFQDGELLIEALTELGFAPVNCIGKPQPLVGYQGDYRTADGEGHTTDASKAMKADIILPRKQVGSSSNDIGFVKNSDGTFDAIVSDYDSSRYNSAWMKKLKLTYAEKGVQRQAKRAGLKVSGPKKIVNGEIVYQFVKI